MSRATWAGCDAHTTCMTSYALVVLLEQYGTVGVVSLVTVKMTLDGYRSEASQMCVKERFSLTDSAYSPMYCNHDHCHSFFGGFTRCRIDRRPSWTLQHLLWT